MLTSFYFTGIACIAFIASEIIERETFQCRTHVVLLCRDIAILAIALKSTVAFSFLLKQNIAFRSELKKMLPLWMKKSPTNTNVLAYHHCDGKDAPNSEQQSPPKKMPEPINRNEIPKEWAEMRDLFHSLAESSNQRRESLNKQTHFTV